MESLLIATTLELLASILIAAGVNVFLNTGKQQYLVSSTNSFSELSV